MIEFNSMQEIAKALIEQTHSLAEMDVISVRSRNWKHHNENKPVVFTKDYYDRDGKKLTWGNAKRKIGLELRTNNRYKSYQDAAIFSIHDHIIRTDISYED